MQPLTFLAVLRSTIQASIDECKVQEYKPEYIVKNYTEKLNNIKKSIQANSSLNRKVQSKYITELTKASLPPYKVKHYDTIKTDLMKRVSTLPSAIDFMKRN